MRWVQSSRAEYLKEQSTKAGCGGGETHSNQDERMDQENISIELGEDERLQKVECYVVLGRRSDNAHTQSLGIEREEHHHERGNDAFRCCRWWT